jgi:replicative DNA helicase
LADLRDSGAVEQDADAVLFIHRPEYYQEPQLFNGEPSAGKAEIILSKFRAGERNQTVVLGFEGKYLSFYDLATETEMTQSTDSYIRNESLKQGGTDFF